jgi:hypothetical protein
MKGTYYETPQYIIFPPAFAFALFVFKHDALQHPALNVFSLLERERPKNHNHRPVKQPEKL